MSTRSNTEDDDYFEIDDTGIDSELFDSRDQGDGRLAIELARYLVWLGGPNSGVERVSTRALRMLAQHGIGNGRWWSEVAEDNGLPVPPEWEL